MSTQPTRSGKFRNLAVGQATQPYEEFNTEPFPFLSEYGPGSVDYLEWRDKRQVGPLIDPKMLYREGTGKDPGKNDIQNLFIRPGSIPEGPRMIPKGTYQKLDYAQADDGTRNDAMQQPVQGTKGDMQAPGSDPLSMISQAIMSLLSGGMPSPGMGGGTTEAPMGGSPFTQMPTQMDLPERNPFQQGGPDEEIMANAIRGPQMPAANQMQEMTQVPPMMQEAQKANAAAAAPPPMPMTPATPQARPLHPPVPTPNPSFHPDAGSLEALLTSMFGQGQPQVPQRNPLFSGGV